MEAGISCFAVAIQPFSRFSRGLRTTRFTLGLVFWVPIISYYVLVAVLESNTRLLV